MEWKDKEEIYSLLAKINKVTARYRHTKKVPDRYMVELCNKQIDFEEYLEKRGFTALGEATLDEKNNPPSGI